MTGLDAYRCAKLLLDQHGRDARHCDDPHVQRTRDSCAAPREVACPEQHQRAACDLLAAIPRPAMGALLGFEVGEVAEVRQQSHEHELGQRAGMHAPRGRDDHVGAGELMTERRHCRAYARAGRLYPPQAGGIGHVAWFKTGGLWVTPKVARAAPTKGFHVSRVTRI